MSRLKTAFLQNYGFALRMTCAVALAWWLAFRFQLDRPAWSIMTVAIVAIPNQGALVAKFIARLIGTFLGAAVVNLMANFALSDPRLFAFYLTAWISCCAYVASCHRDMTTYCFALSGYRLKCRSKRPRRRSEDRRGRAFAASGKRSLGPEFPSS